MIRVLVVDDERSLRDILTIMLKKEGYEVLSADTLRRGMELCDREVFDLLITDLRLPDGDGVELLRHCRQVQPEAVVMVITAYASAETAVNALRLGAYDYFVKPFDLEEVRVRIANALEKKRLEDENVYLRRELKATRRFDQIIGSSRAMVELFSVIPRVAATQSTVLITGESGTGKELVARAIHAHSPRQGKPFLPINCGALQDTLLESELFGHIRGSFTGAIASKKGLFEAADGGTLFLDEIGQTSPSMQVKVLRALQERRIRRLGGTEEIDVDVRIIAATNSNLEKMVEEGTFREDLFYRVNVIPISLPSLRERTEDIPHLAQHFLEKFAKAMGKDVRGLSKEVLDVLMRHAWPGNVRELENVMERAVALEDTQVVLIERIDGRLRKIPRLQSGAIEIPVDGMDLNGHLDSVARAYMSAALDRSGGVQKDAATLLGLSFRSFRYLMLKFGMKPARSDN
ncbi:MAG: sigma-54 dependent transcriptional regulator [Acidobacteriota bacterium]